MHKFTSSQQCASWELTNHGHLTPSWPNDNISSIHIIMYISNYDLDNNLQVICPLTSNLLYLGGLMFKHELTLTWESKQNCMVLKLYL